MRGFIKEEQGVKYFIPSKLVDDFTADLAAVNKIKAEEGGSEGYQKLRQDFDEKYSEYRNENVGELEFVVAGGAFDYANLMIVIDDHETLTDAIREETFKFIKAITKLGYGVSTNFTTGTDEDVEDIDIEDIDSPTKTEAVIPPPMDEILVGEEPVVEKKVEEPAVMEEPVVDKKDDEVPAIATSKKKSTPASDAGAIEVKP